MTKIFYLLFACTVFSTVCTAQAQCNAIAINGISTSGAFRAPNSRFQSGRLAYIITASEIGAANVANGQQITGIGWVNTIAPGITATGNFKLYLQNTNDLAYTKSTDWATAISDMQTVHDGSLTIPNSLDYSLTSFTGGTPFTYTGNAVYVAFEWTYCAGPLSTAQSVGCNNALVGGANGSSSLQSLVSCIPGTTLVTSAFRPITRLFFDCHTNDIKVNALYSMGKLALGHSDNHIVTAYVSNTGTDPVNNIPVTLTVSGVNTFTNTQTIPSLAAGQGTVVSFPAYTPGTVGNNDVTVSVPADDVNANNSKSIAQVVTVGEMGFKDVNDVSNSGAGFPGSTGIIASRLNTATGGLLGSVRVAFNSANGSTYRIAIYGDNNGVPSNTALYTDAADRTVTAIGDTVLQLSPAVQLPAGNFYIAVRQLSTINMGLRYTIESPLRAGVFFGNSLDLSTGWADASPALTFRYNVDALFNAFTITSSAGANGTISPAGVTGVANNGSQSYTITPSTCYNVADVLVDGISVGAVNNYTFSNVTANHTISASFALQPALVAPVISGPTNVCAFLGNSTPVTYTANSAGATNYSWTVPPNVNVVSGAGTANLTLTFNSNFSLQGNKQLRVTAISVCGTSSQSIYYLNTQLPGTPAVIVASSTDICGVVGTNVPVTYTTRKLTGATSYIWTAQAGTTTISHPNGAGVNDTTVTVTFTSGFTSSAITVQSVNGCGAGGTRSYTIIRNNPTAPSMISGPTNVCDYTGPSGVPATYSVNGSAGTSYNWTLPPGSTGIAGQGTNSISFTYPSGFTSGTISVTATNGCGTGPARTLSVSILNPSTPGPITVQQTGVCPGRIYFYSIPGMPSQATSIQWTVPDGGTIITGQGTTSIGVSYQVAAVQGLVTATGISNCGISSTRTLEVNLPACPGGFASNSDGNNHSAKQIAAGLLIENTAITIAPNPSTSSFKLTVNSFSTQVIHVRLLDISGKQIKAMSFTSNQPIIFGTDLRAGIYMLKIEQDGKRRTERIVKL